MKSLVKSLFLFYILTVGYFVTAQDDSTGANAAAESSPPAS